MLNFQKSSRNSVFPIAVRFPRSSQKPVRYTSQGHDSATQFEQKSVSATIAEGSTSPHLHGSAAALCLRSADRVQRRSAIAMLRNKSGPLPIGPSFNPWASPLCAAKHQRLGANGAEEFFELLNARHRSALLVARVGVSRCLLKTHGYIGKR
jgi:hypothetical protein